MELDGDWPPLLVHQATLAVIDGAHRLAAANALGIAELQVVAFEGTEQEAQIEAIRRNNRHGLPLTLADRKRAASRLIGEYPEWSDGRIGEICSLNPKTIATLRSSLPSAVVAVDPGEPRHRLGRDNKLHPVDRARSRAQVEEALERFPTASLRLVAAQAGVSPETVRTVRRSLGERSTGARPLPETLPTIDPDLFGAATGEKSWSHDSALASTPEGRRFAAWFDDHDVDDTALWEQSPAVPMSRLYEVIDEARRRSRFWAEFAARVEMRVCPGRS